MVDYVRGRGAPISAIEQMLVAAATAFVPLYLADQLSASDFGAFALLQVPAVLWVSAIRVSLGGAVMVATQPGIAYPRAVRLALLTTPILAIGVTVSGLIVSIDNTAIWVVAAAGWGLGLGLADIRRAAFYGEGLQGRALILSASQCVSCLLLPLAAVLEISPVRSFVAVAIAILAIGTWISRRAFVRCASVSVLDVHAATNYLLLYSPTATLVFVVPWLLNGFYGQGIVGAYRLAQTVGGLLVQPLQVLQQYFFARAAIDVRRGVVGRIFWERFVLALFVLITLLVSTGLVRFATGWGLMLFGETWALATGLLVVVTSSMALAQVGAVLENWAKARSYLGAVWRRKAVLSIAALGSLSALGPHVAPNFALLILVAMNVMLIVEIERRRVAADRRPR